MQFTVSSGKIFDFATKKMHNIYFINISQKCHSPPILDADLNDEKEFFWRCATCTKSGGGTPTSMLEEASMPVIGLSSRRQAKSSSPSSSSSSSSNCVPSSSGHSKRSSSDHHGSGGSSSSSSKSKSQSSSSKHGSSSSSSRSSGSKSTIATPNINIISADKRIQNMKKKAVKTHESKRKHKSSH